MFIRFILLLLLAFSSVFGAEGAGGGGNSGSQIPYPGVGTLSSQSPIALPGFYNFGAMPQTYSCGTSHYDPAGNTIVAPGVVRSRTINVCGKGIQAYLIEGAATNLLAAGSSETWTGNSPQGSTHGSNTTVYSPDPTQLMNLLVESAATSPHYLTQTFSITGAVASYQIILKPYGGLQYVMIREGSQTGDAACYDLVNGVVNSTAACFATCTAIGNGLFRCTISINNCATGTLHFDTATLQSPTTTWASATYAGDITKGFYWWGQMAEASAFPTSYVSNRNLLSHSNVVSATGWTLADTTATTGVLADSTGVITASHLAEDGANATHYAQQTITKPSATAMPVSFTTEVKAAEDTYCQVCLADNGFTNAAIVVVNLSAGTCTAVGSRGTGMLSGASVVLTNLGNGWYKVVLSGTTNTATQVAGIVLTATSAAVNTAYQVYTGTAGNGIYIARSQLEYSATATALWVTDSAPGVRDADNLSVSLASIVDPRTNLLTYSEQFDNAAWTKTNSTVTANAATDPNGNSYADAIVDNTTNGVHTVTQYFTIADSSTCTFIVNLKQNTLGWAIIQLLTKDGINPYFYINLATGVKGTINGSPVATSVTPAANGYYRCSITANMNTGAQAPAALVFTTTGNNVVTYAGTGQSIYAFGAQVVQGTDPGAAGYIPTAGTAWTTGPTGLSVTSGTLLGLMIPYGWTGATGVGKRLFDDGSVDANVGMLIQGSNGVPQVYRTDSAGGHNSSAISAVGSGLTLVGETYSASSLISYQNGAEGVVAYPITQPYAQSTSIAVGTVTGGGGNTQLYGWVGLLYWNGRVLTSRQLITLYQRTKVY